jgi:hypothetical protein
LPASAPKPSEATPDTIQRVHSDAIYAVATWNRFVLTVWRREMTAPGVAMMSRAIVQTIQNHPGQRVGLVTLIEEECAFSSSGPAFESGVDLLKRFGTSLAGSAIAYGREGFWNATVRGRVTSTFNESKTEVPYVLRPTLAEACAWLREQAPDLPNVPTAALVRAVEQLRSLA